MRLDGEKRSRDEKRRPQHCRLWTDAPPAATAAAAQRRAHRTSTPRLSGQRSSITSSSPTFHCITPCVHNSLDFSKCQRPAGNVCMCVGVSVHIRVFSVWGCNRKWGDACLHIIYCKLITHSLKHNLATCACLTPTECLFCVWLHKYKWEYVPHDHNLSKQLARDEPCLWGFCPKRVSLFYGEANADSGHVLYILALGALMSQRRRPLALRRCVKSTQPRTWTAVDGRKSVANERAARLTLTNRLPPCQAFSVFCCRPTNGAMRRESMMAASLVRWLKRLYVFFLTCPLCVPAFLNLEELNEMKYGIQILPDPVIMGQVSEGVSAG